MKLRTKITVTSIALAVLAVVLMSALSSWQINSYLDRRMFATLSAEENLLDVLFSSGALRVDSTGAEDDRLNNIARILSVRLSLIRKDGVVLYDSQVPRDSLTRLENHARRPEILRARGTVMGTDRRKSASVDQEFVYAARGVYDSSAGVLDSGYVRIAMRADELRILDTQIQLIVWSVGFLAILLVAAISYQVAGRVTRPILSIAKTAQSVKNGDLGQRALVRSRDEIGQLATAINDMAENLGNDITRLRKLERVRSEFLANVSHELRTPIFSMQGFIETLLDGAVDDPNVNREFLEKAHRHATRLNALLNDLIEISRIESGEMKMSFRYFPVVDLLRQVVDEMKPQAEARSLRLELRTTVPADDQVYGDRERLKQVMVNLIDNAIKYTEPGGTVTCAAAVAGDRCAVSVEDTGCGIAEEHQSRIFERFYRADRDRSREVGGTGLGLAIVKHIAEAHGTSIRVTSEVGKGSVFSFSLKR
jgi:two-component system phosphate regulon sensor histidine kinase PhoR